MSKITYPPEMLPRATGPAEVVVVGASTHITSELVCEHREDGYWIGFWLPQHKAWLGEPVGPFATQEEADRALDELEQTSRSLGGILAPGGLAN